MLRQPEMMNIAEEMACLPLLAQERTAAAWRVAEAAQVIGDARRLGRRLAGKTAVGGTRLEMHRHIGNKVAKSVSLFPKS